MTRSEGVSFKVENIRRFELELRLPIRYDDISETLRLIDPGRTGDLGG